MHQDSEDYIAYRLKKSKEAAEDARLLAANERWNAAVNRLYYACFYAVSALLLSHKIDAFTHSGCKTQFGLHFVKTGIIDAEQGRLYADLMDCVKRVIMVICLALEGKRWNLFLKKWENF